MTLTAARASTGAVIRFRTESAAPVYFVIRVSAYYCSRGIVSRELKPASYVQWGSLTRMTTIESLRQ